MVTIQIDLDESVLKSATSVAEERGTTVAAMVQDFVESLRPSQDDEVRAAVQEIIRISDRNPSGSGSDGLKWSRDEIYDDAISRT